MPCQRVELHGPKRRAQWLPPAIPAGTDAHMTHRCLLVAGAHIFVVEIETPDAGGALVLVTVPREQRDRILRWCRKRILGGSFDVRSVAGRTRKVELRVQHPLPADEH